MSTNNNLLVYFFIGLTITLTWYPSSIKATALNTEVSMTMMTSDSADVIVPPGYADINEIYMGSTEDHLVFAIRYFNVSSSLSMLSNVTIRTETGDLYLISSGRDITSNDNYHLFVTGVVSLDNPLADDSQDFTDYSNIRQVYFDQNTLELGFYINWGDIGGRGSIDAVIWELMPKEEGYDRAPDMGFFTFNPSSYQVDRIIDFPAALADSWEDGETDTPTDSTNPGWETDPNETESIEGNSSNSGMAILLLIILGFGGFLLYFSLRSSNQGSSNYKPGPPPPRSYPSKPVSPVQSQSKLEGMKTKFVEALGREVRMCCYQTARLKELYCYCGRAVDEDLQDLFNY